MRDAAGACRHRCDRTRSLHDDRVAWPARRLFEGLEDRPAVLKNRGLGLLAGAVQAFVETVRASF